MQEKRQNMQEKLKEKEFTLKNKFLRWFFASKLKIATIRWQTKKFTSDKDKSDLKK